MREANWKKDRPFIGTNQTQCPTCGKMFASDSICEKQKPYARLPEEEGKKGRVALRESCIDPLELGLIARERTDGVLVWGLMDDAESERRKSNLAKARAARSKK